MTDEELKALIRESEDRNAERMKQMKKSWENGSKRGENGSGLYMVDDRDEDDFFREIYDAVLHRRITLNTHPDVQRQTLEEAKRFFGYV